MKCETARGLLSADHEPPPEKLESLFEHIDICYACLEFFELAAPKLSQIGELKRSEQERQNLFDNIVTRLELCQVVHQDLIDYDPRDTKQEPSPNRCSEMFVHLDDCDSCASDLDLAEGQSFISQIRPTLLPEEADAMADLVAEVVAREADFVSLLNANVNQASGHLDPSEESLLELWQWLDQQPEVSTLEASKLAVFEDSHFEASPGFVNSEDFTDSVMALVVETGTPFDIQRDSPWWRNAGPFLATAAALLLALNLWDFDQGNDTRGISVRKSGPSRMVTPVALPFRTGSPNLRVNGRRFEWATFNGVPRTKTKHQSNPARLHRRKVEYSLPQGYPTPSSTQSVLGSSSKSQNGSTAVGGSLNKRAGVQKSTPSTMNPKIKTKSLDKARHAPKKAKLKPTKLQKKRKFRRSPASLSM